MIDKKDLEGVVVEKQRIGNTSVFWEITEDETLVLSGEGDPCINVERRTDIPWYKCRKSIKSVIIEKGVTPKSMRYWFFLCTSIEKAPTIPEGVEDCSWMFFDCESLTAAPTIPEGVKDCSGMFYDCKSLTEAPVIPEGVKYCNSMFFNCTSLEKAPAIPKGVENCRDMFNGCKSLVEAPVIPEGVAWCQYMFSGCTSLVEAPIIPEGVKNCDGMFYDCTSLVNNPWIKGRAEKQRIGSTSVFWEVTEDGTLVLSGEGDTCINANSEKDIPWYEYRFSIKSAIIEKGVTPKSTTYWFSSCTSLKEAPLIPEGVEDCSWMFNRCASLKKVPVIPEGVEKCYGMFNGCVSLMDVPVIPPSVRDCRYIL